MTTEYRIIEHNYGIIICICNWTTEYYISVKWQRDWGQYKDNSLHV